jgi:hypothetical protein
MGESDSDRVRRNFNELLQELRVAQTGNQILFAFLLALAFTQRFEHATTAQKSVYAVTLMAAAAATAFIITPSSHHRLAFRRGVKPQLLAHASCSAIAGLVLMMIALVGTVFLAVDAVAGEPWAAVLTASAFALYFGLRFAVPVIRWTRQHPQAPITWNGAPGTARRTGAPAVLHFRR